jgi:hypothetical protein
MKKLNCGVCVQKSPGLIHRAMILGDNLFEALSTHGKGHTRLLITPIICEDCLFEYLHDSQWSIGWPKRAHLIYVIIASMYHLDGLTPAEKKAVRWAYSMGTSALSTMCLNCGDTNTDHEIIRNEMPTWLFKANEDLLLQYLVPKINHEDYDNLLCEKCTCKYEKAFVRSIPKDDLPLHVTDKWLFNPTSLLFEKRLKSGK